MVRVFAISTPRRRQEPLQVKISRFLNSAPLKTPYLTPGLPYLAQGIMPKNDQNVPGSWLHRAMHQVSCSRSCHSPPTTLGRTPKTKSCSPRNKIHTLLYLSPQPSSTLVHHPQPLQPHPPFLPTSPLPILPHSCRHGNTREFLEGGGG